MSEIILQDIQGLETITDISDTQASVETGSSNPLEFAWNNPLDASLIVIGALAVGAVGHWVNKRTAQDQNETKSNL